MKKSIFLLTVLMLFMCSKMALAENKFFTVIHDIGSLGRDLPSKPVKIERNKEDGSFNQISYVISSTGATSGIRYRTAEINVTIGNYTYYITAEDIRREIPASGKTTHDLIIITRENIIDWINEDRRKKGLGKLTEAELEEIYRLMDNANNIKIGAKIEIYNANTGKVLDTITSAEEVTPIARKHGFSQNHINDMLTRFNYQPIEQPDSNPLSGKEGLRPSIIVK